MDFSVKPADVFSVYVRESVSPVCVRNKCCLKPPLLSPRVLSSGVQLLE